MSATSRIDAVSPVQFDNVTFNPVNGDLNFDISIRRLVESHKAAFTALATAYGATLGSLVTTVTGTANLTTGDIDIHVLMT